MKKLITALSTNDQLIAETFCLPLPNKCPYCSIAYADIPKASYFVKTEGYPSQEKKDVYSMYFCPHCERLFLVVYGINKSLYSCSEYYEGHIKHIYPERSYATDFSRRIHELSPRFVEIFQQSEKAEHLNLTEICGMGYRKSLEFLVKDYAVKFNSQKISKIQTATLASCIGDYVNNPRIRTLAQASAWIGNDETHYIRKHDNYNIQHLKLFIEAMVSYVDSELSYLAAEELLTTPKK